MRKKLVAIGCDHAGFNLKKAVIRHLGDKGYEIEDFGTRSDERTDYPDYGHPVANMVERNEGLVGVVICGSGNGINMTVNKHSGVRSALCWAVEIARLARRHNNANIIALPARFISIDIGLAIVDVFLETEFEGGRHERRVAKIPC